MKAEIEFVLRLLARLHGGDFRLFPNPDVVLRDRG